MVYKTNIFSVTSTKVGELNNIVYAEFKYVISFSLSRKDEYKKSEKTALWDDS
jgi:hypothetical protein